MDGARIFNAVEYLKVPVARVARDVDSVCFCLSKNLCCPVGSLLIGNEKFCVQARRLRKALGGGMRQVGFLAAAGLFALAKIVPTLKLDHEHARQLAKAIADLKSSVFNIDLENLNTNILMIYVSKNSKNLTSLSLSDRLVQVKDGEVADGICDKDENPIIVKSNCKDISTMRVVFYHQIDDEKTQLAIKKIIYSIHDLEN